MPQVNNLEEFSNQIEYLLEKYQADPELSKKSLKHQQNLEKLLDKTNKLLEGDDTVEIDQFDNLLKLTQNSYKQMRENNKTDKEFQKKFEKKFGGDVGAGSLNKRVFDKMSMTLSDLSEGVKTLNRNAAKDVGDTALTFAGGPLAKMATEMFDFRGAASALGRGRGDQKSVRGMMHAGSPNVPKEGSYYLDEGERVVSRKDNDVLARFAEKGLKDGIKVNQDKEKSTTNIQTKNFYDEKIFNNTYNTQEHLKSLKEQHKDAGLRVISEYASPQYASSIADEFSKRQREDGVKLDSMGSKYRSSFEDSFKKGSEPRRTQAMRQHREVIDNSRLLRETVEKSNKELEAGIFLSAKLQYQRFMRNPFFHSGRLLFKTMLSPMKWIGGILWRFLFGKRMTIQEKQLRALEEQTQLLQTGQIGERSKAERGGMIGSLARAFDLDKILPKSMFGGRDFMKGGKRVEGEEGQRQTQGIPSAFIQTAKEKFDRLKDSFTQSKDDGVEKDQLEYLKLVSNNQKETNEKIGDQKKSQDDLVTLTQKQYDQESKRSGVSEKPEKPDTKTVGAKTSYAGPLSGMWQGIKRTFSGPKRENHQRDYYKGGSDRQEDRNEFLEKSNEYLRKIYEYFSDDSSSGGGGRRSGLLGMIGGGAALMAAAKPIGIAALAALIPAIVDSITGSDTRGELREMASNVWGRVSDAYSDLMNGEFLSAIGNLAAIPREITKSVAKMVWDVVSSTFDKFIIGPTKDALGRLGEWAGEKLKGAGHAIVDAFRNMINSSVDSINSLLPKWAEIPTIPEPDRSSDDSNKSRFDSRREGDVGVLPSMTGGVHEVRQHRQQEALDGLRREISHFSRGIAGMNAEQLAQRQQNERIERALIMSPQNAQTVINRRDQSITMPKAKEIADELGYTLGPSLTSNQQQEIRETQRQRAEVPSPSRENIDDLLTYIIVNQF